MITGQPIPRDRPALIHPGRGGLVHPDAGRGEPGARSVTWELLDLYAAVRDHHAHEVLRIEAPAGEWNALRRLVVDWLEFVLERRFRAALAGVPVAG